MAILAKPRYEIFAQSVASGKKLDEAYSDAGFVKNRGNASKLMQNTAIQLRVQELQEERAGKITQKIEAEILYTREALLAELEEARLLAIDNDQPSAAVSASVGKARILGLIIDRREVGDAGAFDNLTDEELVANAAKKARELGIEGPQLVEDDEDKVA